MYCLFHSILLKNPIKLSKKFRIALNTQDVIIISKFVCSILVITLLPLLSLAAERELFSDWFAVPVALEQVR